MVNVEIDVAVLRESFLEEAAEHVAELERGLLELEETPSDHELLNRVFRAAHSLKGGSASVGFQSVTRFTHVLENLLDPMRDGRVALSEPIAGLLLRAVDVLKGLLDCVTSGATEPDSFQAVLAELEAQLAELGLTGADAQAEEAEINDGSIGTYEVTFAPGPDVFREGTNPVLLLRDLAELGEVLVNTLDLSELPPLAEMDPERCYLRWSAYLDTPERKRAIRDVFAFVEDSSQIEVREVARDWMTATTPEAPVESQAAASTPAKAARAPAEATGRRRTAKGSTLRVATDKVDKLVDLVGELVIAQSMVAQALSDPSKEGVARARAAMAEMERNTRELQERVMAVRMVPIGSVFNRFPRLVRDLSAKCGKDVRLEMSGQEIEIDKSIVEEIVDPLTHLLRNALDHGVESPEERLLAGKPEQGVIQLSAFHQSGSVIVEVCEDGRGLDTARIRAKAAAVGLIRENDELSQDQIHALIFEPGFSTAAAVTDVSGRGVGMDVVKRNVDALNGSLSIASVAGAGTRVRIKLPLTLAIMDGLSFRIGADVFVLPLLPIVESIRPSNEQLKSVMGRGEVVRVRGESIPLVRLYELLGTKPEQVDPRRALVVIVEAGQTKLGLLVDEVLGQAQVVVKSLELNYRKVDTVMGATILGTGSVALILDVEALARRALGNLRAPQGGIAQERATHALGLPQQQKEARHGSDGTLH